MAYYRLGNVVSALAAGGNPQGVAFNNIEQRAESDGSMTLNFIKQAQVAQVYGYGCRVYIDGASVFADGATDEPFEAGQMVYVSQTQGGGWIIHGSVKS